MKLFKVMCVIALALTVTVGAFAETQSVKISGDITSRAFARADYDLDNDDAQTGGESTNWSTYLQSSLGIQIDADLTDNVAGVIRLVNQRVWGDTNSTSVNMIALDYNGTQQARAANGTSAFEVDVDLAYIELKEFLYSPLTLKIGRQDIFFGRGFIVGANLTQPNNNLYAAEYTEITSFDAIRATLDYDPWTIDTIYAKISENNRRADDDMDLSGINVGYVFDNYNAEAEAYWFWKQSRNPGTVASGVSLTSVNGHLDNSVHTFGMRGSFDPIEDWTVALEGAYQAGEYMIANQQNERTRSAWAIDAMVECRYFQDDFAWKPVVSLEYIFYSGENNINDQGVTSTGDYEAWDGMFRGKFDTAIREWQNIYYATAMTSTAAATNQHQILVKGCVEPTDSLTIDATYAHFWLAESIAASNTNNTIGDEVDLQLTWDYTEDVSFNLLAAWFFPGKHFASPQNDTATDIVGSIKLSF